MRNNISITNLFSPNNLFYWNKDNKQTGYKLANNSKLRVCYLIPSTNKVMVAISPNIAHSNQVVSLYKNIIIRTYSIDRLRNCLKLDTEPRTLKYNSIYDVDFYLWMVAKNNFLAYVHNIYNNINFIGGYKDYYSINKFILSIPNISKDLSFFTDVKVNKFLDPIFRIKSIHYIHTLEKFLLPATFDYIRHLTINTLN